MFNSFQIVISVTIVTNTIMRTRNPTKRVYDINLFYLNRNNFQLKKNTVGTYKKIKLISLDYLTIFRLALS